MALSLVQYAFRGRNDGVVLNSSTFTHALNTDWSQDVDTTFRCRYQIKNTGRAGTGDLRYIWKYNHNGGGWATVDATSPLQYDLSGNYSDDDATTQVIGTGSFTTGCGNEGSVMTDHINIPGAYSTEFEGAFSIDSGQVSGGDTIDLRMYREGSNALKTYTNTPTITVVAGGTAYEKTLTETINIADSILRSITRTLTDTVDAADAIARKIVRTLTTETVNVADVMYKVIGKLVTNIVNVTDSITRAIKRVITNTTNIVDLSILVGLFNFIRDIFVRSRPITKIITLVPCGDVVTEWEGSSTPHWSRVNSGGDYPDVTQDISTTYAGYGNVRYERFKFTYPRVSGTGTKIDVRVWARSDVGPTIVPAYGKMVLYLKGVKYVPTKTDGTYAQYASGSTKMGPWQLMHFVWDGDFTSEQLRNIEIRTYGDSMFWGLHNEIGIADIRADITFVKTEKVIGAHASIEKVIDPDVLTEKVIDSDASTEKVVDSDASTEKVIDSDTSTGKTIGVNASTGKVISAYASTEKVISADASTEKVIDSDASTEKVIDSDASTEKVIDSDTSTEKVIP